MTAPKANPMPRAKRGSLSGQVTAQRYGKAHMQAIGALGGGENVRRHGRAQMSALSLRSQGYDVKLPSDANRGAA